MGQDITSFNRAWTVEHLRGRRPSLDNVGVWFSSIRGDKDKGAAMYAGEHGQVYRVHLAIKNPWVTTFANMADQAWQLNGCPELRDGVFTRSKGSFSPEPLRDWLKNQGYDGIKVIHDPARQGTSTEFKDQDAWIVLEPDQVRILGNAPAHPDEDPAFPGIMP
jgi:phosphatidylserine/phosphatidylglycerophosphate/cardiolipin synthase-like enzyme